MKSNQRPIKRRKLMKGEEVTLEETERSNICHLCYEPWKCFGEHRCSALECGHVFGHKCIHKWVHVDANKNCPICKNEIKNDIVALKFDSSITESLRQFFFYEWQHEIKKVKRELRKERNEKESTQKRMDEISKRIRSYYSTISSSPSITTNTSTLEPLLLVPNDEQDPIPDPPPISMDETPPPPDSLFLPQPNLSNLEDLPPELPFPNTFESPSVTTGLLGMTWLNDLKERLDEFELEDEDVKGRKNLLYSLQKSLTLSSQSQDFVFIGSDPNKILVDSRIDGNLNQHFLSRGSEVVVRIRILNGEMGEMVNMMISFHQIVAILTNFGRILLIDLQRNRFVHTLTLPDNDIGTTIIFSPGLDWWNKSKSKKQNSKSRRNDSPEKQKLTKIDDLTRIISSEELEKKVKELPGYHVIVGSKCGKIYFYDPRNWKVPFKIIDIYKQVKTSYPVLIKEIELQRSFSSNKLNGYDADHENASIRSVYKKSEEMHISKICRLENSEILLVCYSLYGLFRCHMKTGTVERVNVGYSISTNSITSDYNFFKSENNIRNTFAKTSGIPLSPTRAQQFQNRFDENEQLSMKVKASKYEFCSSVSMFPGIECFEDFENSYMVASFIGDESIQTYFFKDWKIDNSFELFKFHIDPRFRFGNKSYQIPGMGRIGNSNVKTRFDFQSHPNLVSDFVVTDDDKFLWKEFPCEIYSNRLNQDGVIANSRIPRKKFLAQACGDRVRIYDLEDGMEFLQHLEIHVNRISSIKHLNTLHAGHFFAEISKSKFCLYSLTERI